MKLKTTYERLLRLKMFLEGSPGIRGIKLMVVVEKNIEKIEKLERKLLKIVKPSKLYKEYLEHAQSINEEYCHRDKEGKPVFRQNAEGVVKYSIKKPLRDDFEEAHKYLEEDYADVIHNYKLQCAKYNEMLTKQVSIKFKKIDRRKILQGHTDLLLERLAIFIKPTFKETIEIYKNQILNFLNLFRKEKSED